ncbi:MAG: DUF4621 domain-containing protein [Bacteroidales bacterium]|nr:DUF4621 domain-containing protein [Bacteroidales bacterium]
MDTTKRLNHLKKAAIAICVALTVPACVDNDYDLSKDIEDDVTLFSKYLELPLGSDYILLRNQLDSIDGIDTTATGDYSFFKKGEITVNVTEAIDLKNAIDTKTSIDMSSNIAVTIPAGEKTIPVVTNTLDFTASKDVLRLDSAYFTEGENLLNITVEPKNFSGNDGSYAKIKVTLPKPLKIEATAGYDVKTEADGRMSFVCNNVSTTQNSPYSVKLIKGIFENSVLKNLSYDVEATIVSNGGITCSNGTGFDVNLKVGTLGFDDIWGVFDIKLDATEPFDFDMSAIWDYFDNPTDNLVFYRPYILLKTTSNISVPANMALQIAAQNTVKAPLTETSNFGMNTANGTAKLGIVSQFAGTSETIEALDINNLMNAKPGNLRITATAAALKDPTDATLQHHITLPATAKIEYTICIPFSFDEGMSITFDEEIEDVFDEDATDMLFKKDSAGLKLDIVNKLPINTKMRISFTDSVNAVIHTLDDVELPLSSDTVHVKLGFDSKDVQDARGMKFQLFTSYGGSKKIINTKDAIYLKMKMYKKGGISVE